MRHKLWQPNRLDRRYFYPPRGRHPCDKGEPAQRLVADGFRWLLDHHYWLRHPYPFAKSPRGRTRREERLFIVRQREARFLDLLTPDLQPSPPAQKGKPTP